jgi:Ca2+-binding EF-hand superfamily protein
VEHDRYALINEATVEYWKTSLHSGSTDPTDSDKKIALEVFSRHDPKNTGYMQVFETEGMLKALNLQPSVISNIIKIADSDQDNQISFDEFYRHIWSIGSINTRIVKLPKNQEATLTDKDKAQLVFEMLDIDKSNYIGAVELNMLLSQWGMEYVDAASYINKYVGKKHKISFDEFFVHLQPVWIFAAQFIFG